MSEPAAAPSSGPGTLPVAVAGPAPANPARGEAAAASGPGEPALPTLGAARSAGAGNPPRLGDGPAPRPVQDGPLGTAGPAASAQPTGTRPPPFVPPTLEPALPTASFAGQSVREDGPALPTLGGAPPRGPSAAASPSDLSPVEGARLWSLAAAGPQADPYAAHPGAASAAPAPAEPPQGARGPLSANDTSSANDTPADPFAQFAGYGGGGPAATTPAPAPAGSLADALAASPLPHHLLPQTVEAPEAAALPGGDERASGEAGEALATTDGTSPELASAAVAIAGTTGEAEEAGTARANPGTDDLATTPPVSIDDAGGDEPPFAPNSATHAGIIDTALPAASATEAAGETPPAGASTPGAVEAERQRHHRTEGEADDTAAQGVPSADISAQVAAEPATIETSPAPAETGTTGGTDEEPAGAGLAALSATASGTASETGTTDDPNALTGPLADASQDAADDAAADTGTDLESPADTGTRSPATLVGSATLGVAPTEAPADKASGAPDGRNALAEPLADASQDAADDAAADSGTDPKSPDSPASAADTGTRAPATLAGSATLTERLTDAPTDEASGTLDGPNALLPPMDAPADKAEAGAEGTDGPSRAHPAEAGLWRPQWETLRQHLTRLAAPETVPEAASLAPLPSPGAKRTPKRASGKTAGGAKSATATARPSAAQAQAETARIVLTDPALTAEADAEGPPHQPTPALQALLDPAAARAGSVVRLASPSAAPDPLVGTIGLPAEALLLLLAPDEAAAERLFDRIDPRLRPFVLRLLDRDPARAAAALADAVKLRVSLPGADAATADTGSAAGKARTRKAERAAAPQQLIERYRQLLGARLDEADPDAPTIQALLWQAIRLKLDTPAGEADREADESHRLPPDLAADLATDAERRTQLRATAATLADGATAFAAAHGHDPAASPWGTADMAALAPDGGLTLEAREQLGHSLAAVEQAGETLAESLSATQALGIARIEDLHGLVGVARSLPSAPNAGILADLVAEGRAAAEQGLRLLAQLETVKRELGANAELPLTPDQLDLAQALLQTGLPQSWQGLTPAELFQRLEGERARLAEQRNTLQQGLKEAEALRIAQDASPEMLQAAAEAGEVWAATDDKLRPYVIEGRLPPIQIVEPIRERWQKLRAEQRAWVKRLPGLRNSPVVKVDELEAAAATLRKTGLGRFFAKLKGEVKRAQGLAATLELQPGPEAPTQLERLAKHLRALKAFRSDRDAAEAFGRDAWKGIATPLAAMIEGQGVRDRVLAVAEASTGNRDFVDRLAWLDETGWNQLAEAAAAFKAAGETLDQVQRAESEANGLASILARVIAQEAQLAAWAALDPERQLAALPVPLADIPYVAAKQAEHDTLAHRLNGSPLADRLLERRGPDRLHEAMQWLDRAEAADVAPALRDALLAEDGPRTGTWLKEEIAPPAAAALQSWPHDIADLTRRTGIDGWAADDPAATVERVHRLQASLHELDDLAPLRAAERALVEAGLGLWLDDADDPAARAGLPERLDRAMTLHMAELALERLGLAALETAALEKAAATLAPPKPLPAKPAPAAGEAGGKAEQAGKPARAAMVKSRPDPAQEARVRQLRTAWLGQGHAVLQPRAGALALEAKRKTKPQPPATVIARLGAAIADAFPVVLASPATLGRHWPVPVVGQEAPPRFALALVAEPDRIPWPLLAGAAARSERIVLIEPNGTAPLVDPAEEAGNGLPLAESAAARLRGVARLQRQLGLAGDAGGAALAGAGGGADGHVRTQRLALEPIRARLVARGFVVDRNEDGALAIHRDGETERPLARLCLDGAGLEQGATNEAPLLTTWTTAWAADAATEEARLVARLEQLRAAGADLPPPPLPLFG